MENKLLLEVKNLIWKHNTAVLLDIPSLKLTKGFATALIGENGAGKSNLLKALAGINLAYEGDIDYNFGAKYEDKIKKDIGYTSINNYFLHSWNLNRFAKANSLMYDNFSKEDFFKLCEEFGLTDRKKPIFRYSDGMRTKTALASVFARDTRLLLLDEPASNLDPIMRDKLCSMMRDYLHKGNGEKTILFSTHNISDMESVTDYAIIMAGCKIVEEGFVEDLKEKYVVIKGELDEASSVKPYLIDYIESSYGYEGLCLSEDLEKLTGYDVAVELPTLNQISMALMRQHTDISAPREEDLKL